MVKTCEYLQGGWSWTTHWWWWRHMARAAGHLETSSKISVQSGHTTDIISVSHVSSKLPNSGFWAHCYFCLVIVTPWCKTNSINVLHITGLILNRFFFVKLDSHSDLNRYCDTTVILICIIYVICISREPNSSLTHGSERWDFLSSNKNASVCWARLAKVFAFSSRGRNFGEISHFVRKISQACFLLVL